MKSLRPIVLPIVLFLVLAACAGSTVMANVPPGAAETPQAGEIPADTLTATPLLPSTADLTTPTPEPSATASSTPEPTPTLDPEAWRSMPIIPAVNENARRIYQRGQELGNDPRAFSILGDCLSLPVNLFDKYGKGPGHFNLGEHTELQPVIDWFVGSLGRQSITLGNGFNSAAVLTPLLNDPNQCEKDETPLECEYRVHKPVIAFVALGTDDNLTPPDVYESRMRQIVEYSIEQGVVPILATKADNREGGDAFNRILALLAYTYDVPLWNFWAAAQPLPGHGLSDDRGHLTWSDPNRLDYQYAMQVAIPVRNLTALQALDAVWRGVTAP
jgi:hypothetical protein